MGEAMRHALVEPGCSCPGSVEWARVKRSDGRRLYKCRRCMQFFAWEKGRLVPVGTSALREILERQSAAEVRPMVKVKLNVNMKDGRPNFGSCGAGAELEFEVDETTVGQNGFMALVEAKYALLQRTVEGQLGRMGPATPPPPAPPEIRPERPATAPAAVGHDRGGYGPRPGPAPERPAVQPGGQRDDPPTSGGQLLGWAFSHGVGEELKALAKAWKIPGQIKVWSRDDVTAAYNELSRHVQPTGGRPQWGG